MWVQSHLLAAVAVFGPQPEALLGAIVPDVLSYTNWGTKLLQGKLNKSVILQGEHHINNTVNGGVVWEAHTFLHSFWIAGLTLSGSVLLSKINPKLSVFLGSYFLHIFLDYFTHKIKWWPLIPYKKWRADFGIFEYSLTNWRKVVIIDFSLLIIVIFRFLYKL